MLREIFRNEEKGVNEEMGETDKEKQIDLNTPGPPNGLGRPQTSSYFLHCVDFDGTHPTNKTRRYSI